MSDEVKGNWLESFFARDVYGIPAILVVGAIASAFVGVSIALLMK